MSTQQPITLNNLVVKYPTLEAMLAELAQHAQKPLVRVSQRAVTSYSEPIDRTTAYILVSAIDQADALSNRTIYFWYGQTGSFEEMYGREFSNWPRTRTVVAKAAAQNEAAIRTVVSERLGEKADVREGMFVLPDSYFSGYGTTKLVDMFTLLNQPEPAQTSK